MSKFLSLLFLSAVIGTLAVPSGPARAVGDESENLTKAAPDNYRAAVRAIEGKDYGKAIGLLTSVLSKEPKNADALNYMGYSHRKLGRFETALAFYKRALAISPDHRGVNEYMGEAYLVLGNLAGAEMRLAHLRAVCGECEEHDDLERAVAAYKARRGTVQSSRALSK